MKISFISEPKNDSGLTVIALDCDGDKLPKLEGNISNLSRVALERDQQKRKVGRKITLFCPECGQASLLGFETTSAQDMWRFADSAIQQTRAKSESTLQIVASENWDAETLAELAFGARLANYQYSTYWQKKKDDAPKKITNLNIVCSDPKAAEKHEKSKAALAEGVYFTRDLVSCPPNDLYPESFASKLEELSKIGVKVEVLDEKAMKKLGMGALLGVAQGSVRPPRLVVMQWNNNKQQKQPFAIVGKGITFDTGGISLKPAKNMEEMKMDMGGAGVVSGLMKSLALQNAPVNVVGVVALAENMPDGNAQRPGDIVTAMDGQTISVYNTDAEGRLVLADALHYTNDRFKPSSIVNLATLTGAIIVALGSEYAGMFSNDDALSDTLYKAGVDTDEKLWRMPLHSNYDKQLNTQEADMKNIGGPEAGATTAAQFLKRFIGDTPWAHLDIAGVTWSGKDKPAYPAGASGFGVTLLNHWLHQKS